MLYDAVPCKSCGKATMHFTDLCQACRKLKDIKPELRSSKVKLKTGPKPKPKDLSNGV